MGEEVLVERARERQVRVEQQRVADAEPAEGARLLLDVAGHAVVVSPYAPRPTCSRADTQNTASRGRSGPSHFSIGPISERTRGCVNGYGRRSAAITSRPSDASDSDTVDSVAPKSSTRDPGASVVARPITHGTSTMRSLTSPGRTVPSWWNSCTASLIHTPACAAGPVRPMAKLRKSAVP